MYINGVIIVFYIDRFCRFTVKVWSMLSYHIIHWRMIDYTIKSIKDR